MDASVTCKHIVCKDNSCDSLVCPHPPWAVDSISCLPHPAIFRESIVEAAYAPGSWPDPDSRVQ